MSKELRNQSYTIKDLPISMKTLYDWIKYGLLTDFRENFKGWHRFTISQVLWVGLLFELRKSLYFPIPKLLQIKSFLDHNRIRLTINKDQYLLIDNDTIRVLHSLPIIPETHTMMIIVNVRKILMTSYLKYIRKIDSKNREEVSDWIRRIGRENISTRLYNALQYRFGYMIDEINREELMKCRGVGSLTVDEFFSLLSNKRA